MTPALAWSFAEGMRALSRTFGSAAARHCGANPRPRRRAIWVWTNRVSAVQALPPGLGLASWQCECRKPGAWSEAPLSPAGSSPRFTRGAGAEPDSKRSFSSRSPCETGGAARRAEGGLAPSYQLSKQRSILSVELCDIRIARKLPQRREAAARHCGANPRPRRRAMCTAPRGEHARPLAPLAFDDAPVARDASASWVTRVPPTLRAGPSPRQTSCPWGQMRLFGGPKGPRRPPGATLGGLYEVHPLT